MRLALAFASILLAALVVGIALAGTPRRATSTRSDRSRLRARRFPKTSKCSDGTCRSECKPRCGRLASDHPCCDPATNGQCGVAPTCETKNPTTTKPTTGRPTTGHVTTETPTTELPTSAKPSTGKPTTGQPTTVRPTTELPTSSKPTTGQPTTGVPTTISPTTEKPTTTKPTTGHPTTGQPSTTSPTTAKPTTDHLTTGRPASGQPSTTSPTTAKSTTDHPTTSQPMTGQPTMGQPTTTSPTTAKPTMYHPTTGQPTTVQPATTSPATAKPTTDHTTSGQPTTGQPTIATPTIEKPTTKPKTGQPKTGKPTTTRPTTKLPSPVKPTTYQPTTAVPTSTRPATKQPTSVKPTTGQPTTDQPTALRSITGLPTPVKPTTGQPMTGVPTTASSMSEKPTTKKPTTGQPTTGVPTTISQTTEKPTTMKPTTGQPTNGVPTTASPTTEKPTTMKPTTGQPTTASPTTETPTTTKPTTGQPPTGVPTTSIPTTKKPTTTKPISCQPATDKPTTASPTTGTPTTTEPTTGKPTTGKPTTASPVTDEPTTRKPTAMTPTTGRPVMGQPPSCTGNNYTYYVAENSQIQGAAPLPSGCDTVIAFHAMGDTPYDEESNSCTASSYPCRYAGAPESGNRCNDKFYTESREKGGTLDRFDKFPFPNGCTYEGGEYACIRDSIIPNHVKPNADKSLFLGHVGDIVKGYNKGSTKRCTPALLNSRKKLFEALETAAPSVSQFIDFFLVVGDNEWNECFSNSSNDPKEWWRDRFARVGSTFNKFDRPDGDYPFGITSAPVVERDEDRPELFYFKVKNIAVFGINEPSGTTSAQQDNADFIAPHLQTTCFSSIIIFGHNNNFSGFSQNQVKDVLNTYYLNCGNTPTLYVAGNAHPKQYKMSRIAFRVTEGSTSIGPHSDVYQLTVEAFKSGPLLVTIVEDPATSYHYFHILDTQPNDSNSICPM